MTVTAIIPVWNGRELLVKLLDSVERQTRPFDRILVVDNGSHDGAPELAEMRGATVIRLGRNRGFAPAINRGVSECTTTQLAILNSDVELDPAWLATLLETPAPFSCGKILSAARPDVVDGTFDLLSRGGCPWRANHGAPDRPGPVWCFVDMAPFTAVLFDRQAFLLIGLLDERFESYLEDVDFGLRCVTLGIRGRYVASAICRHHGSATLGRWHGESVRRMARNQVFLLAKHYPRPLLLRWWWPILVAHGLWGLLAFRHRSGLAWLRGKWQGIRQFRTLPNTPNPSLASTLQIHEATIRDLQKTQGMDWYWRVYFGLAGDNGHTLPVSLPHE